MGQGSSSGRTNTVASEVAAGRIRTLSDYSQERSYQVDENNALELIKRGIQTAKVIASVTNPGFCVILSAAEFAITGYQQVSYAIDEGRRIWNSDASTGEKISRIANRAIETTNNITREGAKTIVGQYISHEISNTAVNVFENVGVFNNLEESTGINGLGDIAKDLLKDTIEEEVNNRIGGIAS